MNPNDLYNDKSPGLWLWNINTTGTKGVRSILIAAPTLEMAVDHVLSKQPEQRVLSVAPVIDQRIDAVLK